MTPKNQSPRPTFFEAALRQLRGIAPNESVVVGDTHFDIEAARRAGSPGIALLCRGKTEAELRQAGALAVYRDAANLLGRYEGLPEI